MHPRCSRRPSPALPTLLAASMLACGGLTPAQEKQISYEVEQAMRHEYRFVRDRVVNEYVADIGHEILEAAGPQYFEYRFYVVDDESINASAAPGGLIYVNTGTILKSQNVSELAGVIAHEIGHVTLRHIAENYGRQRSTNVLYQLGVVGASMFGYGSLAELGGGLAAMAVLNSFGRGAEAEADAFAVAVLPKAGYDPDGLVTFFETLQHEMGSGTPGFLSDHPTTEDRIAETRALIAALPPSPRKLVVSDRGKLEIIQRRIQLLTGKVGGSR